ncbi:MAG: flagellar export protein FliJ [Woeseiaceae bacterium]
MAVKRSDRFKPIHNLAEKNEMAAAQTLGKIQRELTVHHEKLNELMKYYQDYTERFKDEASKGMSIIQVQSYQKFISQLDQAIKQQKEQIQRVTEACNSSKAEWNVERQKTQVLEKVITRYQRQEQKVFNRQEQRLSDEHVTNQFWHKVNKT